ncbi:MAG: hypothetical protein NC914_02780 [Candidatus Omnitrophica bacterium]|nr:hypothetical protein [Candidatus Omnitrophota bacterium]
MINQRLQSCLSAGRGFQKQIKQIALIVINCLLLVALIGCEAFVKKFTRKPKEEKKEEMVLIPEDYTNSMTPEERYRQYFLFWKSWQDELIVSLMENRSLKKRVGCAMQATKNLEELRKLLVDEDKQKLMDKYIAESKRLSDMISGDIYGNGANKHREKAESIKRNVVRDFTYSEIKNYIIQ